MVRLTISEKDRKPGKNVVLGVEDFPGAHYVARRTLKQGLSDMLFESPVKRDFFSDFVLAGYSGCMPVCDPEIIRARQSVIELFKEDFRSQEPTFLPALNMMHLVTEWMRSQWTRPFQNLERTGRILARYQHEIKTLVRAFKDRGGFLEEIAGLCVEGVPKKTLDQVLQACEKGAFDYAVVTMNPRVQRFENRPHERNFGAVRIQVGMGELPLKNELVTGKITETEFGITPEFLVEVAVKQALQQLNSIYGILGALYCEAAYHHNREKAGLRVCKPEINIEGRLDLVEAEPFLPTENPVGVSISYDRETSRVVLSGLHSGGKSYLLQNLPLHYLAALSGFSLPAKSATVPVIYRLFHSLDIDKKSGMGSLASEIEARVKQIKNLKPGDLFVVDEFLQHASPDAASPLEPVVLEDIHRTGATVIVVTHRGEGISEDRWNVYHPDHIVEKGALKAAYTFGRGRPDQEVLRLHAKGLLDKSLDPQLPLAPQREPDKRRSVFDRNTTDYVGWFQKRERRILSGDY